jgi:hypothetical protein
MVMAAIDMQPHSHRKPNAMLAGLPAVQPILKLADRCIDCSSDLSGGTFVRGPLVAIPSRLCHGRSRVGTNCRYAYGPDGLFPVRTTTAALKLVTADRR